MRKQPQYQQPAGNHDPLIGTVLDGRYQMLARLGEGGMGVVYKARQTSIDRTLALKMLNPQMAQDPTWVQRFYNEAKACSRLQHPNTIRMYDFGQTSDGRLFMTMEFLDGISLRAAIDQGPMTGERVAKIIIQCCASLAEAHSLGIIHRDIKPDNVFLLTHAGAADYVKLLDFSVAKLLQEGDRMHTQAGMVFGTPQYMSPEQGRGLPLDARSDLYALGILAFEMLTGSVPFHDDNPMTVIQMHLRSELPPMPASVPHSVQQLVRRATEKDAARRYQSAGEMMQYAQQAFAELSRQTFGSSNGFEGQPGPANPMLGPTAGSAYPQANHDSYPRQHGASQGGYGQPSNAAPPGYPVAGGYATAAPMQKTMVASLSSLAPPGHSPNIGVGMPMQTLPATALGSGNDQSHLQKTMIAGAPPVLPAGFSFPPIGSNSMLPGGGYPQAPAAGGPNRTIMLQPSDGIVSVARNGGVIAPAAMIQHRRTATSNPPNSGVTITFWIICLLAGIALGALAFVVVRQM
jgi:serine/threonine protein kinase